MSYPTHRDKQLLNAFSSLKTEKEVAIFLRDLLTLAEISEFSQRFQIASLLWTSKLSYKKIAQKVGTSTTTVTRVAHWLYKERWQGYSLVLKRLFGTSQRKPS